jgi:rubrerythrin
MGDTPTKAFQRRKENFTCEKCGNEVTGNGYTNHCPKCLHSKHVDINPGDRAALESCGGLMKPIGLEIKSGSTSILHRCVKCGFERKNKASQQDSQEALISLSVAEY